MELLTIGNSTAQITALKADRTGAEIGVIKIGKEDPLKFSLIKLGGKKKKGSLQGQQLQQPTGLGKKIGQDRKAFAQLNQEARDTFALSQETKEVAHEPLQDGNKGVVFQQPIEGTKAQALQGKNPFKENTIERGHEDLGKETTEPLEMQAPEQIESEGMSEPRGSIERHEPIEDHGADFGGGDSGGGE